MDIHSELSRIQKELKAPKGQWNDFSKYNYRSCEDILEAVKPLLGDCTLILSDDIHIAGDRVYIKATATLSLNGDSRQASSFAREPLTKKGMDDSQITGSASSYARKYALNGLFAIDDEKDADSRDNRQQESSQKKGQSNDVNWYNDFDKDRQAMLVDISSGNQTPKGIIESLQSSGFKLSKKTKEQIEGLGNGN